MADTNANIAIVGYGMWTASGHDGPSNAAAMQAVVPGAMETRLWDRTGGVNMQAFQVSSHQWWGGETFLPELAYEAIRQCHEQLPGFEVHEPQNVPILISVAPNERPGRSENLEQHLMLGLKEKMGYDLPAGSGIIAGGRTGIASLLRNAAAQIDTHPVQIIVGVESFLQQVIVEHYIDANRMMCVANSSGFVPGEGAAALIVTRSGQTGFPELRITGIGEAQDKSGTGGSPDAPVTATGLTNAIRDALSGAKKQMYDIGLLLADLNGEHFKFKEAMIASMRLDRLPEDDVSRRPHGQIEHWNAAETIGEVGAALMPAAIGWAFEAGRTGGLPVTGILFHAGEDDGSRIAIVGEFSG